MNAEPVLSFEPSNLSFPFQLNKQIACSIRLLNRTENYVAFKLLTTNPKNYGVRPRIGILSPGTVCNITVTMRAMREAPHNMRCKDKFMIQSAVAGADTTREDVRKMFNNEAGDVFHEAKLRVVYTNPPESSLGPSVVGSPKPNVPEMSTRNKLLDVQPPEVQFPLNQNENNSNRVGELILRGIVISLLCLASCYLMKQTLSSIWSLTMVAIVLMMKMLKKLVSESVEDWVVKTLLYVVMHFLFRRKGNVRLSSDEG